MCTSRETCGRCACVVAVAQQRRGEQTSCLSCARAGTDEGERGVSVVRERMGVSSVRVLVFVPESRFQAQSRLHFWGGASVERAQAGSMRRGRQRADRGGASLKGRRCVHAYLRPRPRLRSPESDGSGLGRGRRFGYTCQGEKDERRRRGCHAWGEAGRACAHDEEA